MIARRLERIGLLLRWLVASAVSILMLASLAPAQAACGVYLAAGSWLSGQGTTVYSNCYQCTDLAERQYDATGWLEGHNFRQVAPTYGAESMIYADGSGWHVRTDVPVPSLSAYPGNGSYTPIPGDLVVMGAEWPAGGGAGHIAVVETVSGSSFGVVEQNPGGRATYTKTGSGWVRAGYTAKGFIHSSRNPLGGPPPPPPGSPIGHVDQAEGLVGGGVRLLGWVMDPDVKAQTTRIHAYVDGPAGSGARGIDLGLAMFSRPDVAAAFPGSSVEHGFNTGFMGVPPGRHTIYVYGLNVDGTQGGNVLLQQVTVDVAGVQGGSPSGNGDTIQGSVGAARVSGWGVDFDAPTQPIDIHAYVDGPAGSGARGINLGAASKARPDVGAAYPQAGPNHGLDTFVTGLTPGQHTIFLYAINKAGAGENPLIGILTAGVPGGSPIGAFDGAKDGHESIQVIGWVIDPDAATSSASIHAYIDGRAGSGARGVDLGPARVSRPDVGTVHPGAGGNHGFDANIDRVAPGQHTVYVYAINLSGQGDNVLLGSKTVTVTPVPPAPVVPPSSTPVTPSTPPVGAAPGSLTTSRFRSPRRGVAILSWAPAANATSYRFRISWPNRSKKWTGWTTTPNTWMKVTKVRRGAKYRFQVQAFSNSGRSAVKQWWFVQRR